MATPNGSIGGRLQQKRSHDTAELESSREQDSGRPGTINLHTQKRQARLRTLDEKGLAREKKVNADRQARDQAWRKFKKSQAYTKMTVAEREEARKRSDEDVMHKRFDKGISVDNFDFDQIEIDRKKETEEQNQLLEGVKERCGNAPPLPMYTPNHGAVFTIPNTLYKHLHPVIQNGELRGLQTGLKDLRKAGDPDPYGAMRAYMDNLLLPHHIAKGEYLPLPHQQDEGDELEEEDENGQVVIHRRNDDDEDGVEDDSSSTEEELPEESIRTFKDAMAAIFDDDDDDDEVDLVSFVVDTDDSDSSDGNDSDSDGNDGNGSGNNQSELVKEADQSIS